MMLHYPVSGILISRGRTITTRSTVAAPSSLFLLTRSTFPLFPSPAPSRLVLLVDDPRRNLSGVPPTKNSEGRGREGGKGRGGGGGVPGRGYQGRGGSGREGGGRGPGGPHRAPLPREGRGSGRHSSDPRDVAIRGGRKEDGSTTTSSFSALLARQNAALAKDLEKARQETAALLQGDQQQHNSPNHRPRREDDSSNSTNTKVPIRVLRHQLSQPLEEGKTNHDANLPLPTKNEDLSSSTSSRRQHRVSHRGGPPKSNFAETVLRPASLGRLVPPSSSSTSTTATTSSSSSSSSITSKKPPPYSSGIPKLMARKRLGHQVHDEMKLESHHPVSSSNTTTTTSVRSAIRGEMMGKRGIIWNEEEEDLENGGATNIKKKDIMREGYARSNNPLPPPSGLREMMMRRRQQQQQQSQQGDSSSYKNSTPNISNRKVLDRQRSLDYLRGNLSRGGGYRGQEDGYDSEDERVLGDIMQKEQYRMSLSSHWVSKENNQDGDGYDSDADLEPFVSAEDPDFMDLNNHEYVRKNDAGEYIFDYDAMDYEALMKLKEEGYYDQVGDPSGRTYRAPPGREDEDDDPLAQTFEYDYYFRDITNLQSPLLLQPTKSDSKALLPLKPHGPELDDFLLAVNDHPSKYAVIEHKAKHPDSRREPRPIFARGNVLPSEEFVKKYKGYLFVTGLVPHLDESTKETLDFDDALHKETIAEDVAKLFGVSSLDVSPASPTSAYIGFGTKLEAKKAMMNSANDGRLHVAHSVELHKYERGKISNEMEEAFITSSPDGADSILKVTGLPTSVTSVELLTSMFPPGSRLQDMFGPLTSANYLRISSTTALISLRSSDLASKALKSSNIANNISVGVGKRPIQVLRAKRERIFDKWTGVNNSIGASKLGGRLFVTGETPPHEMYLSHNDTLHISGLPPSVTLHDLATFFQPFCADRRDVFGSGHIVRCSQGISTGCAYIGFELPGEIDQVREVFQNGKAMIGDCEVIFRTVQDKLLRRGKRQSVRPSRSIDELYSDLNDWERHVDPKDIAELEQLGIEKGVLDEIMLTLRHHNRTFAAGDQSILGERLYEERQVGTHYRDVVRRYLKVLRSCVGTRDDPGLMYEAMFRPDEEVDMGLFDIEEERIKDLRKKEI